MVSLMIYMTYFNSGLSNIAKRKTDAVVLIETTDFTNQANNSIGAGFFIGPNLIVTNTHVVDNATDITVRSYNSSALYDATVIAKNYTTDIAIIKINDWADYIETNDYSVLEIVSSRNLKPGDTVWSIGHPWGLYWTVSHGITSSADRRIDATMMYYIQTDAATHQGNSGGPLLNSDGDVVGIVSKVFSLTRSNGFGLAIPSDIVSDSVRQLELTGTVYWSTIGIDLRQSDDGKAVKIVNVLDWPSTKDANIKPGDILTEITTRETGILGADIKNIEDFLNVLVITDPESEMILTLLRDGKTVYATVVTESMPIF